MEHVSLKDIAKAVGVSVATVSLVLNGKDKNGRVSKEMSEKIVEKAKELNYVPNSLAKGLKMGHSKTIGLIVADISNVFFGTLALHIQNYAEKEGYTVVIGNTNEKLEEMQKVIIFLNSRQVDGLIITPAEESEKLIKELMERNKPLVLVDRSFPELNIPSVLINNYEISYYSTQKLIDKGCRNPAFVSYKQNQFHTNERKRGFIEAVKSAGMYKPENIKEVRYQYLTDDMNKAISELINSNENIDGIFFATNSLSLAGVKSLFKHNINIQRDIQVMCFDETEAFNLLPFSVPFIKQPIEKMAKEALKLLLYQIENKGEKVGKSSIEAQLII
ncbi:MAG: LacI family DNA-binding transcriptional regulator [Bacteroidia bacterium]|nr:LacI family DNA-binding transcriptional regulator [Bacteroidia bacterium]